MDLLTNARDIAAAQMSLVATIGSAPGVREVRLTACHRAGRYDCTAFLFHGVWMTFRDDHVPERFWNVGGRGGGEGEFCGVEIEVNPPFRDRSARVQGAFARRGDRIWLVHRGRVGGAFTGATREAFWRSAGIAPVPLSEGLRSTTPVAKVCLIDGQTTARDLARFIVAAGEFKDRLRAARRGAQ